MSNQIQAVILAGGLGTRLLPYTEMIPKPLVPVGGKPVLEIVLHQLRHFGYTNVAITLGHLADLIKANFGDGSSLGLNIEYFKEEKPLGTAGPLNSIGNLAEDFLVLNGDLITTLDFQEFFTDHIKNKADLTIAAHERYIPVDFGVIEGQDGKVANYIEKPNLRYRVSMGIYAFNREVIKHIPQDRHFDFPELVQDLTSKEAKVNYYSFDGYWLDIGSGADYERASAEFESMKGDLLRS
jgi:NDP-sugar pyrophosphorylase family protein